MNILMKKKHSSDKTNRIWYAIFAIVLLIGMSGFFAAHPLYIYDTDDWLYVSYHRHAIPNVNEWNPTKIFPETLMPLCAQLAVRFIMPFTGNYTGAMGMVFAVAVSLFILGYMLCFGNYLSSEYGLSGQTGFFVMTSILLFHFLPFNVSPSGNMHMFWAENVNCVFNYTIPSLLNSMVVFVLMNVSSVNFCRKRSPVSFGVCLLIIYLSINSNMFQSIILSSLAGSKLLISIVWGEECFLKQKGNITSRIQNYGKQNVLWLSILAFWFCSLVFEVQGGRAAQSYGGIFTLPVKQTAKLFLHMAFSLNKIYLVSSVVIIILGLLVCIHKKISGKSTFNESAHWKNMVTQVLCFCITGFYLILLCAKVEPSYIQKSHVIFGLLFYAMVMTASSLAYLLREKSFLAVSLPLLLYILIFETVISGKSFAEYNIPQYTGKQIMALNNYYISQIEEAVEAGLTESELHVVKHPLDTWPLGISYGSSRIAQSLYYHGLIPRMIYTPMVPDANVNAMFHLSE